MINLNDTFETMATFLGSADFGDQFSFIMEVIKDDRDDLVTQFLDHDLLSQALINEAVISASCISSMGIIATLYPRCKPDDCYVIMASVRRQIEPVLFFGVHGKTRTEQTLAVVFLAKEGHLDHVRTLLDLGVPYSQAFATACERGNMDMINLMMERDDSTQINLTAGLCRAIEMRHDNIINLILNLTEPLDYTQLISAAALAGHHDIMGKMLTLAANASFAVDLNDHLPSILRYTCSKGYHEIVKDLLNLRVPIDLYAKDLESYDILIKNLLLERVRLHVQHSRVIKHFIPCLKMSSAFTHLHRIIRRQRLQKAAVRMILVKDELIAVYFSPERLPCLLPHRVNDQGAVGGQLIRRAAYALKLLF